MPLPPPSDRQKPYGAVKKLSDMRVTESPVSNTEYVKDTRGNAAPRGGAPEAPSLQGQQMPIDFNTQRLATQVRELTETYRELAAMSEMPGASPVIIAQKDAAYRALLSTVGELRQSTSWAQDDYFDMES